MGTGKAENHAGILGYRKRKKVIPKLSDFLLDLHQSLVHQGLAKSLDISIGMPALFANLVASRS